MKKDIAFTQYLLITIFSFIVTTYESLIHTYFLYQKSIPNKLSFSDNVITLFSSTMLITSL